MVSRPYTVLVLLSLAVVFGGCDDDPPFGPYRFGQHQAHILASGSGSGTVRSTTGGIDIDCSVENGVTSGGTCSDRFADGGPTQELRVGATPDPGSYFVGWSGCSDSVARECLIRWRHDTPDTTYTLIVHFERD